VKRCVCLVVVLAAAGCGGGSDSPRVTADGRIGPLQIDVSTEADVRDFAGKPFEVAEVISPAARRRVGHELHYRCGRSCTASYGISDTTGRLVDYWVESPRFVTARGSRVGMPAARAARLEGRKIVPGCGEGKYIHLRWDERHIFVLGVFDKRVSAIAYQGPHTLAYEGLC
jgi:hypothetical protein